MAWHKVGNSYYSDAEMRAKGGELYFLLIDIGLPGFLTYLAVTAFSGWLDHYHFFVVHTTTAKLVCIVAGLFSFTIAYELRKWVMVLAALAVIGVIALGVFASFLSWLFT